MGASALLPILNDMMPGGPHNLHDRRNAESPRERRRSRRVACEQWIAAAFEDRPGEPVLLRCCNISRSGLAFLSRRPIPLGLRGAVRIISRSGRSGVVGVEVVRCDYLEGSRHITGLRFCEPPQDSARLAPLMEVDRRTIGGLLERLAR